MSANKKANPTLGAAKKPAMAGISSKAEKEADLVMGTNNSSIVSKRSVEMLYYPKPHFFRYFVKKPQRRSPLINRGYWLRMHAMAETVRQFMRESSGKPKFVLNLGCGFDPLPFILLSEDPSLCRDTRFVDIDYEKLMINKKTAIRRTDEITQTLKDVEFLSDESAVQIRSTHYLGIGCDLKNLKKLDDVLRNEVLPAECSVLFLAEVSLTYMDVKSANAVLDWASKLNNDAKFCILEQFFPDGPDHPFASTMMKHFKKLGAPLYSIHEYPSLSEQEQRFKNAGWRQAHARSLWDLWSDDGYVSSSLRSSLNAVEPFDEWEEFALFASHYFLLIASTSQGELHHSADKTAQPGQVADVSSQFALLARSPAGGGQRRFGALVPDGEHSFGYHAGLGRQTRLATTNLYSNANDITGPTLPFPSREVPARMCHTVTHLASGDCLLVGGRASPAAGLQDCWLRQGTQWRPTQNLPVPRFRHSATRVTLDSNHVLLYGGKTSDGTVLDVWLLWSGNGDGWKPVETFGNTPRARFGACLASIDNASGFLFGGISADGIVIEDFWTWKLHRRSDGSYHLELHDGTEILRASPLFEYISRFGATATCSSSGLVIVGGIIPRQIVPYDKEIMLLDPTALANCLAGEPSQPRNVLSAVGLGLNFGGPRPLLVGHASYAVDPNQVLVLGGGAVCFSFGTFWTEGTWLLKRVDAETSENEWNLVPESAQTSKVEELSVDPSSMDNQAPNEIAPIPRVKVQTAAQFQQILADGKPVIIEGSDLGPCTERWTKEYLGDAVGRDRKVVVHEAHSENMSFQAKNFSYTTKEFGSFLDEVHTGGRQYLRSISAEEPTKLPANLAVDFPNLKDDFCLPEPLSMVVENAHSSPLRISGPVTLWLHYDVMANVLCQIRGEKRLILFPPSDVEYLQVPAGASSSTINIFQNHTDGSIAAVPHTSPQEAVLCRGDILFIPPLWLHTASPTGQVSVAVNVFFRNLSKGYAAGRDVYGNRDLQAYEKARNDLQKIAKSFDGLPPDMARFYLLRLAKELRDKAEA
ncbi:leucine carboxyl methyltransferase [Aspergillus sclerotioniger CBS 115572]|uniref:tRNA wybutosine-synthesizing protein 4 n=1 Tax=Aspergillus sclerotioniger CBS 115572 TaxID=1450535 RepID=A0A317XBB9_9EURO|nr:leucine carboxyl methyltransferase [Aspergillus sclerotioniger CBS 115572]PWY95833.1 leucine carboxyl methyltransferase [Aspergillus sclerotioniger CBS 115572]